MNNNLDCIFYFSENIPEKVNFNDCNDMVLTLKRTSNNINTNKMKQEELKAEIKRRIEDVQLVKSTLQRVVDALTPNEVCEPIRGEVIECDASIDSLTWVLGLMKKKGEL